MMRSLWKEGEEMGEESGREAGDKELMERVRIRRQKESSRHIRNLVVLDSLQ